ncbi:MAG: discoidin domain-containing protein [Akkermansiaceae bacterium]|nr:discoidin domain-containing protein [Akkermansiaceae bacterium]
MNPLTLTLIASALLAPCGSAAPVLDARKLLAAQNFWINEDFDWYERNIPLFDCPDQEINTTYYYRWELVTRHLVYGNPNHGYAFTEFANRPFWSGAYGTISCPAGLQINEVRWLHNPRYVRDYVRFWMRHPGAQPRNYSFWAADSAWAAHLVQPNDAFITDLLPDLVNNYQQWEKRGWVEEKGLFWQLGHDDGMEFDINAQQTKDILRGGQSLRPSFNSYMWADASAIANIARLKDQPDTVAEFSAKAGRIKTAVQENLWDPDRQFFFPMSNQEHEKDGHVVKKHTLTYQSGQFAGSPYGRELHGYVPWAFNLPDAGFENAWQFLMDDQFFKAEFGPTTVERNDPLFALKEGCCWWCGQSWPFATTQTLKAMANLLQHYQQKHVQRQDYAELLHTYAATHRKDGKPYIAEAAHPFTGSWNGHDMANRSEHYFHSGFTDLIITGLVGIQPATGDNLTIHPLAPDDWDYFALDNLPYHGHLLSIVWDRTGDRYHAGKGFRIRVDGRQLAEAPTPGKLTVNLPATKIIPVDDNPPMNYAVNNDGDYYPRYRASFVNPQSSLATVSDGQYVYDIMPANRWTTVDSPNPEDWVEVDFGTPRPLDTVNLYVLDDGPGGIVQAPAKIDLGYWDGSAWKQVPDLRTTADVPLGRRPHTLTFPVLNTSRLRAVLHHADGARSGLTEFEAWGPGRKPYVPAPPPAGNIAYNPTGNGFPKITASHSDVFGGLPPRAIDGKIIFEATPANRWTSYGSPNASDWLELEFDQTIAACRAVLHIYDDHGGVQAPADYHLEGWTGSEWKPIPNQVKSPAVPTGNMANTVTFPQVKTNRLRVVFTHHGNARSGLTELEVWEK